MWNCNSLRSSFLHTWGSMMIRPALLLLLTCYCTCQQTNADVAVSVDSTVTLACSGSGNTQGELSRLVRAKRVSLASARILEVRNCVVPRTFWQEARAFGMLQNLTFNRVRFEQRTIAAGSFTGLQLRHLVVIDTDLLTVEPGAFNQEEAEDVVFLNNEHFWLQDAMFHPLRRLDLIELAGSNLSVIPTRTFEGLSVRELCLENNGLQEFPVAALSRMHDLHALNLRANPMRTVPSHCAKFPNLSELILADCQIDEVAHDAFVDLPYLQSIDLSENQLAELDERTFKENYNLQVVHLRSNELTSLPSPLLDWPSLSVLDLSHNRWLCSCQLGWTLLSVKVPLDVSCHSPVYLRHRQLLQVHPQQCVPQTTVAFTLPTGRFVDVGWLQKQTVLRGRLTTARRPRPWVTTTTAQSSTTTSTSTSTSTVPVRLPTLTNRRTTLHKHPYPSTLSTIHDHPMLPDVTSTTSTSTSTSTSTLRPLPLSTASSTLSNFPPSTSSDGQQLESEDDQFPPEPDYLQEPNVLLGFAAQVDSENDALPVKSVGGFITNPTIAAILIVIGLLLATFLLLTLLIVTASNIREKLLS